MTRPLTITKRSAGRKPSSARKQVPARMPKCPEIHQKEELIDYLMNVIHRLSYGKVPGDEYRGQIKWFRHLADVQGWIPKPSMQITQAQAVKTLDEEEDARQLQIVLKELPSDIRTTILEHIKRNKTQPTSESAGQE